jgi:class 3 adenylate cyclase
VIYGRAGEVYAPVVARGASLAPTFPKASPLLRALAERGSPVDLERGRRALLSLGASAEDRGAIGGMGAVALLPIVSGADLLGLVALGRKRSGDVYTAADLALLGVVAAAIQAGLSRLGEKELLQEARALQERLRRYVPASLASELARGRALESGEREVTVLFADLRSYTSLSQGRLPEEIFAAVSRYAALVSECVVRHAGTVVEYAGDGLMAVFGAPEPLPGKERAAVTAALEIARVLADLELFPGGERGGATAVGIGVATGEAYVGTIQSVDHNFWSAIGHTTNLAARLQSLTRDLDAWVAVDEATWRGAGEAARAFERRPRVAIRGLAEPCDVFVLRAPSAR